MELRVLGPLQALAEGATVPLGGPKQRTVLALLIQDVGRRVTIDQLILGVYGDGSPRGARRTVQTYVSNLRQGLGEVIRGTGDGYVLELEPSAIDARRFEAGLHAAVSELEHEPERAASRLHAALALWRGHPYADVEGHGALDAEVARLQELRLAALERRIEADLALGRHRELLGELESLTAEHPFRESLRAHHVVALYRAGRQSDALAGLERTRRVLADELGIDPSTQLQQLERRILTQDPTLDHEVGPRVERRTVLVAELDAERWSAARRDAALADRDEVLATVVDRAEATIVGLRGTAVFVAFGEVSVAAETALALARLGTEPTLRVAIDHGEVEVRDEVVTGPRVNRAARIVALAHPGQVLLSSDAHAALSTGGVAGWSATALGRHTLAGIDGPVPLYQLQGEGVGAAFPPLRSDRLPPPVPRAVQHAVPGYELRTRLGGGDASVVHRAYQASVGREVALRTIRGELAADPAFIRRFEAEGQRVARLTHPHLLPLLDYWRDPEGAYLVHPLVSGGDLGARLARETATTPGAALHTLERIGAALSHAHAHGVLHGRLHPGNVLLDEDGNLYVADLGLAQMCEGLVGSSGHAYTAPEALGGGPVSVAADVYALGVLAAALVQGQLPPDDGSLPLPPGELGAVLARASSPQPADRYAEVSGFLAALRAAISNAPAPPVPLTVTRNPYRGLKPFLEADARDFHGREALIDEMVAVLAGRGLLTVVGPSGIGKSSVVRAGLVPAIRDGAIDGSDRWLVTDLFPGSRPFEELAAALRRVAVAASPDLTRELRASDEGLLRCAERVLPPGSDLLLVLDQFEELFTQTSDEDTRRRFLEVLATAASSPGSRVRIVATLRADFFDRPLCDATFGELMRGGVVAVRAPSREELARSIREPARAVGVAVEEPLVEQLVRDAEGEPGALPLVQHVLAEGFETREADVLTLAAYEGTGGLRGAVGRKAEELYLGLTAGQRDTARQVFLRLVTVDDEDEDTRRRVRSSELSRLGVDEADLRRVLEVFSDDRLLTFDRDPVTRGPTVEVAHESLLHEWDRLRGWIDEVREELLVRRRITAAAREWLDAGRDPSFLLRGARLAAAEEWQRTSRLPLTGEEEAYLVASRLATTAEVSRSRRRRRATIGGLAAALVATMVFSSFAVVQRGVAEEEQRLTRARELGGEAMLATSADPELAILLGIEAVDAHRDTDGRPVPQAVSALHAALQATRVDLHLPDGKLAVAVSPDGALLATDSVEDPTAVRVVEIASGEQVASVAGRGEIGAVAFSPDGAWLAASYLDTSGEPAVETFDVGGWASHATFDGPPGPYVELTFTEDGGQHLVAVAMDGGAIAWDVATGNVTTTWDEVVGLDTIPRSSAVALTQGAEEVRFADVRDGGTIGTLATPGTVGENVAVDGTGTRVAVSSFPGRTAEAWDRETGERLAALGNPSPLRVGWSPDGRLAHSSNDGTIRLVDIDSAEELALHGHGDGVTGIAFAADGQGLASVSWAEETRVWDISPEGPPDLGTLSLPVGLTWDTAPAGDEGDGYWVSVNLPDQTHRVDLVRGPGAEPVTAVDGFLSNPHFNPVLSYDGSAVAGLDLDQRGRIHDLPTGELRRELPACQSPRALSHDGSRIVVDGRMLCTDDALPVFMAPPPEADLRSAVLDARTGEVLYDLGERPLNFAALGPSGTSTSRYVVVSVDWQTIEVHDVEAGRLVGALDIGPELSTSIWFSDDGRHVAFGTQSGLVTVLDLVAVDAGSSLADATVWSFREPAGGVVSHTRIAGGRLATGSMAGRVRVYDLADRRLLADLEIEALNPVSVSFTADAAALRYEDGRSVRRLELDPERLVSLARSRLTRDFAPAECARYRIERAPCVDGDEG